MAIVFTTGTINEANAGAVGLAMMERIRDDLVAHTAWELVEEFTPASGLARWYVFKCLGTENGMGIDFFVVFGRTLGNGELKYTICEGYDSGTKTMTFFPITWSGNQTYDAQGRSAQTSVLGTAVLTGGLNQPIAVNWAPSGTSTKWWITVEMDGFTIAFNGASNSYFHAGRYTFLGADANLLPIHMSGNSHSGGITRNPAVAGVTLSSKALEPNGTWQSLGYEARLDVSDKLHANQRPVAELALDMSTQSGAGIDPANFGKFLGKMRRIRRGSNPPAGVAFGDAYVFQDNLWVPWNPTDGRIFDTGVAA